MDAERARKNSRSVENNANTMDSNKDLDILTYHINGLIEKESLAGLKNIVYDIRWDKCPFGIKFKDGYSNYLIRYYEIRGFSFYTIYPNIHISW